MKADGVRMGLGGVGMKADGVRTGLGWSWG